MTLARHAYERPLLTLRSIPFVIVVIVAVVDVVIVPLFCLLQFADFILENRFLRRDIQVVALTFVEMEKITNEVMDAFREQFPVEGSKIGIARCHYALLRGLPRLMQTLKLYGDTSHPDLQVACIAFSMKKLAEQGERTKSIYALKPPSLPYSSKIVNPSLQVTPYPCFDDAFLLSFL